MPSKQNVELTKLYLDISKRVKNLEQNVGELWNKEMIRDADHLKLRNHEPSGNKGTRVIQWFVNCVSFCVTMVLLFCIFAVTSMLVVAFIEHVAIWDDFFGIMNAALGMFVGFTVTVMFATVVFHRSITA